MYYGIGAFSNGWNRSLISRNQTTLAKNHEEVNNGQSIEYKCDSNLE